MAIMIRECMDGSFYSKVPEYTEPLEVTEAAHDDDIDPNSLMVEIEAIHAFPFATRNFTRYMPKCLKNSVPLWTSPYRRPLIKHHNEKDGDVIGRTVAAEYVTKNTLSGTPALKLTVNVPGKEQADIKNGLLATTSIGAIAHDVRCSICGQQITGNKDHDCEHVRGVTYKTEEGPKICTWDIYEMEPKEISFVVVPSDIYSKKVDSYPAVKSKTAAPQALTENFDETIKTDKGEPDMATDNKNATELAEAQAKVAELETQLAEAKKAEAEVVELKEAKTVSEAKIAELEAKIVELEEAAKNKDAQMAEEAKLRESLETTISETKAELKESLIETMQLLRKDLGRNEIDAEVAKGRTEDSIRDSITDLKEELSIACAGSVNVAESVEEPKAEEPKEEPKAEETPAAEVNVAESVELPKAASIEDPTLNDGKGLNTTESAEDDNSKIDLRAGLDSLLGL